MKRRILILISVLIVINLASIAQDTKNIKSWSVSLSYAPKFEILRPLSPTNDIFFKSFEMSVDHRISQHISFGVGINYQNMKKTDHSIVFDGDGIDKDYRYDFTYIDFPIQMNYYFLNNPMKMDPYVKAAFINSYYRQYTETTGINYYQIETFDKHFILWDLGIGSSLKINKKLSINCQASLGFGINHFNPQYTFIKTQIGLSYNLIKK